jgi:hypothetical protein
LAFVFDKHIYSDHSNIQKLPPLNGAIFDFFK